MNPWIPVIASSVAALIAGTFALIQLWQSGKNQKAVKEHEATLLRREKDLEREKTFRDKYRQDQILPFLEALDKALVKSYTFLFIPEGYIKLGAYFPQIRNYSDKDIREWLETMELMSSRRMQLFNAINPHDAGNIMSLLTRFVELSRELMLTRHQIWFQQASLDELRKIHRSFIDIGYRLMIDVRNSVLNPGFDETSISSEAKEKFVATLAVPFEQGSFFSIPFGAKEECYWYAVWEINKNPEIIHFISRIDKHDIDEFVKSIGSCTSDLYKHENVIQASMMRVEQGDIDVYCMLAKFNSKANRDHFIDTELPTYRKRYAAMWSLYRSPHEFTL